MDNEGHEGMAIVGGDSGADLFSFPEGASVIPNQPVTTIATGGIVSWSTTTAPSGATTHYRTWGSTPESLIFNIGADDTAFTESMEHLKISLNVRLLCAMQGCTQPSLVRNVITTLLDGNQHYPVQLYVCDVHHEELKYSLGREL